MNSGDGIDVAELLKKKKNGKPIYEPQHLWKNLHQQITIKKNKKWLVVRMDMGKANKSFQDLSNWKQLTEVRCKNMQQFAGNMKVIKKPKILIILVNHIQRLHGQQILREGITEYSDDMINLMMRRVYDIAGITDRVFQFV